MVDERTVTPAQTVRVSIVVFAQKIDCTLQLGVDYCKVNGHSKQDSHPVFQLDQLIDAFGEAIISLTMDANCGYRQI